MDLFYSYKEFISNALYHASSRSILEKNRRSDSLTPKRLPPWYCKDAILFFSNIILRGLQKLKCLLRSYHAEIMVDTALFMRTLRVLMTCSSCCLAILHFLQRVFFAPYFQQKPKTNCPCCNNSSAASASGRNLWPTNPMKGLLGTAARRSGMSPKLSPTAPCSYSRTRTVDDSVESATLLRPSSRLRARKSSPKAQWI